MDDKKTSNLSVLRTALRYIQVCGLGGEARPREGRETAAAQAACTPRLPARPASPPMRPRPPPRGRRAHGPADVSGAPHPGGGGVTGARARGSAALALGSPPPPGGLTEPCHLHGPRDSVSARNPPRLTACRALLPGEWEGRRATGASIAPAVLGGNRIRPQTLSWGVGGCWAWLAYHSGTHEIRPTPPRAPDF